MTGKYIVRLVAIATSATLVSILMARTLPKLTEQFQSSWPRSVERVWVGPEYWANRLQDWRIANGRLACVEGRAGKPMRTVHLLTRRLADRKGSVVMSVRTGLIEKAANVSVQAAAGFLIGAGSELDYRAAALVHHSAGSGAGLFAGIDGSGCLFIRDFSNPNLKDLARSVPGRSTLKDVELHISVKPSGGKYTLKLTSSDPKTGEQLVSTTLEDVEANRLVGSVALASHPGQGRTTGRFWFSDWKLSGTKVDVHDDRVCGPILSTQYTLSRNILKMTAQMMPIGQADTQTVKLQVRSGRRWKTAGTAKIIAPGWTATFRIEDWVSTKDTPYRVVYDLRQAGGTTKAYIWSGTVRRDPVDKTTIVVAGFTGNHNVRGGVDRGKYTWKEDWLWFPHNKIVDHVSMHKPDVLFFSGDQVYEGASPTGADRSGSESSYLDYLYKWYLWCWAFRDLTRDIPCVTIPDDHDVYQGNLWGGGGRKTQRDNQGGYMMPAGFVKMVERTQTSNLPDPYDPTPIEQGIGVYYTAMNYGRISFAILEDRKFKSGCAGLVPKTKSGRADHVVDPNFDPRTADVPGAKLLGDRQLKFLKDWALDWRGADMKMALSQTMFAGMATHHGGGLKYLVADYDSNGWPQTGRNKALDALRRAFAFHLGGDQHLATVVNHGIDYWNDACWSFCVPSIANFYPRAWKPLKPGKNRKEGMPDYTGEFLDGLGNHVTVWAATNPGKPTGKKPAALHDRMPGYGIVRLNKENRTITIECWPRYADPRNLRDRQYLGWPITIKQIDNYGRKAVGYLPTIEVKDMTDPVIQVIDESDGEIIYALRIKGNSYRPKVFKDGFYTIKIGEPGTKKMRTLQAVQSLTAKQSSTIIMKF